MATSHFQEEVNILPHLAGARREIFKCLLRHNDEIQEQEVKAGLWEKKKPMKNKKENSNNTPSLFD